jgi:hypothetical protein
MLRILYQRALPANGSSRNTKTDKISKRVPATMVLVDFEGQLSGNHGVHAFVTSLARVKS